MGILDKTALQLDRITELFQDITTDVHKRSSQGQSVSSMVVVITVEGTTETYVHAIGNAAEMQSAVRGLTEVLEQVDITSYDNNEYFERVLP